MDLLGVAEGDCQTVGGAGVKTQTEPDWSD